jgi:hypothetical protein
MKVDGWMIESLRSELHSAVSRGDSIEVEVRNGIMRTDEPEDEWLRYTPSGKRTIIIRINGGA